MNEEKVKDLLREKGLKVTSQRLMVLNILSAHGDEHLTVEEIYDLAKEESPEIGLATIYRTVQVLLELHGDGGGPIPSLLRSAHTGRNRRQR